MSISRPLARRPLLDWSSFAGPADARVPSVADLPNICMTTSGRSALFHAIKLSRLRQDATVLVPTYHCPTMVAAAVFAERQPSFFPIDGDGLPLLDAIPEEQSRRAGAIIVPHYFGIPRSLGAVRSWSDQRGIAVIEDCAHTYYGMAGERPVGAWGDYATASLSKFFPVPEGGLVASALHPVPDLKLVRQGALAQLKGLFDLIEIATAHQRLAGLGAVMMLCTNARRGGRYKFAATEPAEAAGQLSREARMILDCDMNRIERSPLLITRLVAATLAQKRIVDLRRYNYQCYTEAFQAAPGAHALFPNPQQDAVPYVFPLWVDDADRIYHELRRAGAPVFRWDSLWPGSPVLAGDQDWNTHVIQFLCHQDLSEADILEIAQQTHKLLDMRPGT